MRIEYLSNADKVIKEIKGEDYFNEIHKLIATHHKSITQFRVEKSYHNKKNSEEIIPDSKEYPTLDPYLGRTTNTLVILQFKLKASVYIHIWFF